MNTFNGAGEVDVREELLGPLLSRLGYFRGGVHNLIREMPLRYEREYLGRKKKGDRPLLGFADYVLEADRKVRWTLEAKPPVAAISRDDIEQAFSYAKHPEVNGQYFVLCNGLEFTVYQTTHAPNTQPLLMICVADIDRDFGRIAALLAPDAVLHEFPTIRVDTSPPLGPGLRSMAKILNGSWITDSSSPSIPHLAGITTNVTHGVIQRYDNGFVGIALNTRAAFKQIQDINESLGLSQIEMTSDGPTLSSSPERPTQFKLAQTTHFPAATSLYDLAKSAYVTLPTEMNAKVNAVAFASLRGDILSGPVELSLQFEFEDGREVNYTLNGTFELRLAM